MTVKELRQQLNGFSDETVVLMEDFMMREIHEVKSISHDRMCEWIQQQMKDVCVISINESRKPQTRIREINPFRQ